MSTVDQERIGFYKAEILEAQDFLSQITLAEIEDFINDPFKIRAFKYTIIILVEAIANLARHILAKKAHVVIEEYMEALLKMQEKGFLSEEISKSLIPLIKLRHQLIHGYWKTDDRRLFLETKNSLQKINEFISEIDKIIITS